MQVNVPSHAWGPRLDSDSEQAAGVVCTIGGSMKKFSKLIAMLACAASLAFAQNVSSSLRATVLDSSGAAVPGAECTLTNQNTGAVLTVKSDSQGSCGFNIIPAGAYSLSL